MSARASAVAQAIRRLEQYRAGRTVQPGVFSTLDEAILDAPFEVNSGDQWLNYLKPGRMVRREGVQFPLKKEELDWAGEFGIEDLIGGQDKLTREEVRNLIRGNRVVFEIDVARESYGDRPHHLIPQPDDAEKGPLGRAYTDTILAGNVEGDKLLGLNRIRHTDPEFGTEYGGRERYHHTSPGSTYEESITRLRGLQTTGHFGPDTLSWSRTTTHLLPQKSFEIGIQEPKRVRIVEEIQSDVHRRAAQKMFHDPKTGKTYESEWAVGQADLDVEDMIPERRGYLGIEDSIELEDTVDELARINKEIEATSPINKDKMADIHHFQLNEEFDKLANVKERLEAKVQNAPFKNPGDYAQMELRKQLMNAVDEGEDYLALARGRDQIERYSNINEGQMPKKSEEGMVRMYDEVYRGELDKLARRYGAVVEDLEIEVDAGTDVRPLTMSVENYDDPIDLMESMVDQLNDATDMREALEGFGEFERIVAEMIDDTSGSAHWENLDVTPMDLLMENAKLRNFVKENVEGTMMNDDAALARWAEFNPEKKIRSMVEDFSYAYDAYTDLMGAGGKGSALKVKSFPAMKLTPEVREKIKLLGVPQFKKGGLVKYSAQAFQMGGLAGLRRPSKDFYEIIPSKEFRESLDKEGLEELKKLNKELSGGEQGEWLQKYHEEQEDSQKYNELKYWTDAMKFIPAYAAGQWKTLDPETGKPKWHFGHSAPPFEMVEMGIMTMDEWQEMKEFANKKNKEDPFHPGIIDDLKAVAALPAIIGNVFGGEFTPPAFSIEGAERMEQMARGQEEEWGLDRPQGFPQHLMGALGTMVAQVPTPASITKGLVTKVDDVLLPLTTRIPQVIKTATAAPRAIAGAGVEFFNPTIVPSPKSYLMGAGFGGTLGTAMEPSDEEFEQMEQQRNQMRFFEENAMRVTSHVETHWDDMDLGEKVEWVNSPYNDAVFGALSDDQYRQMMQDFEEAGLLEEGNAEQE